MGERKWSVLFDRVRLTLRINVCQTYIKNQNKASKFFLVVFCLVQMISDIYGLAKFHRFQYVQRNYIVQHAIHSLSPRMPNSSKNSSDEVHLNIAVFRRCFMT